MESALSPSTTYWMGYLPSFYQRWFEKGVLEGVEIASDKKLITTSPISTVKIIATTIVYYCTNVSYCM